MSTRSAINFAARIGYRPRSWSCSCASLAETLENVRYLKSLGAHEWNLDGVTLAKQQAYAIRYRHVVRPRRARLKPTRQTIEGPLKTLGFRCWRC